MRAREKEREKGGRCCLCACFMFVYFKFHSIMKPTIYIYLYACMDIHVCMKPIRLSFHMNVIYSMNEQICRHMWFFIYSLCVLVRASEWYGINLNNIDKLRYLLGLAGFINAFICFSCRIFIIVIKK